MSQSSSWEAESQMMIILFILSILRPQSLLSYHLAILASKSLFVQRLFIPTDSPRPLSFLLPLLLQLSSLAVRLLLFRRRDYDCKSGRSSSAL